MSTVKEKTTTNPRVKKVAKKAPARKRSTAPKKNQTNKSPSIQTAKNSLSIMALSPFRFPLDVDKLALHTARIGGVAFVFLGILFSYHYLESAMVGIVQEVEHSAQVGAAVSCGSACDVIDKTPDVDFSYGAFEDGYRMQFTVPKAENLNVYAYQVDTGTYHTLGTATQAGENKWEYEWLTSDMPEGDYWIKALITNTYGMYDRSDTQFITVQ